MGKQTVGVLHPGNMGISVAASIKNSGHEVYWVSEGRSEETRRRAEERGLRDALTLAGLCDDCDVIVSVCPPHAAEEVARQVVGWSFAGVYVDANAISPQQVTEIARMVEKAGASFVDGGIVGGPAWEPGQTWLYLSGKRAQEVAGLFAAGPMETSVIGDEAGKASALKMCYAAYTKGTTALLSAILATAENLNVRGELEAQWERNWPGFAAEARERVRRVTAKAWRFAGEMDEIAATFRSAGLPGEFHEAAKEVYQRIAKYKDEPTPALEEVLESLAET